MSFWDSIKPSKPPPTATAVDRSEDRRTLTLTWNDGRVTESTGRELRGLCPCAACVDEFTRVRRHAPTKVPGGTTIENISPVGNYAIALTFSDGHGTGIFTWEMLRQNTRPTAGSVH